MLKQPFVKALAALPQMKLFQLIPSFSKLHSLRLGWDIMKWGWKMGAWQNHMHGVLVCVLGGWPSRGCSSCTKNSSLETVVSEGDKESLSPRKYLDRNTPKNYRITYLTNTTFSVNVGSPEGICSRKRLHQWPGRQLLAGWNQLPTASIAAEKGKHSRGQELEQAREERA